MTVSVLFAMRSTIAIILELFGYRYFRLGSVAFKFSKLQSISVRFWLTDSGSINRNWFSFGLVSDLGSTGPDPIPFFCESNMEPARKCVAKF